jgi:hypothetical protein
MSQTRGRRIYADVNGDLRLAEGDYGYSPKGGCWQVRPPGCHAGSIPWHDIIEHEDGTITVSPSILLEDVETIWHGYLKNGNWEEL